MLLKRAEGLHPGYEAVKELLAAYILELNHYGKAKAVGDAAQTQRLAGKLERVETVLAKVLQGAVYATSLAKDNFSDAVIRHFGETSLAKIEEITATMQPVLPLYLRLSDAEENLATIAAGRGLSPTDAAARLRRAVEAP